MNDPSLQQKYDFALDYIRSLEARIKELEDMIKDWPGEVLEYYGERPGQPGPV